MKPGDTIILSGKTQHGKNRVREQGKEWTIIHMTVAKPHGIFPAGTAVMLLKGVNNPRKDWRWVRQFDDKNFAMSLA